MLVNENIVYTILTFHSLFTDFFDNKYQYQDDSISSVNENIQIAEIFSDILL